jgi:hypothetical protein
MVSAWSAATSTATFCGAFSTKTTIPRIFRLVAHHRFTGLPQDPEREPAGKRDQDEPAKRVEDPRVVAALGAGFAEAA